MKRVVSVLLLFTICAALAACTPKDDSAQPSESVSEKAGEVEETGRPVSGGTLRLCLYDVDTLNPILTKNENNRNVLSVMYDGLFKPEEDMSVTPALCESASVSDDGLTYSLSLRRDVSFHGGESFSAADVLYTFNLISLSGGAYASALSEVASYSVSGAGFKIVLKRPVVNFTSLLTFPILKASGAPASAIAGAASYSPNGTGKYRMEKYYLNKALSLAAVDGHFSGKKPYIPAIEITIAYDRQTAIKMFENSLCDVLTPNIAAPGDYTPKANLKEHSLPTLNYEFLGVNNQRIALLDSVMRKALSAMLDRDYIIDSFVTGRADKAVIPVNPTSSLYYDAIGAENMYMPVNAAETVTNLGWTDTDGDEIPDKVILGEKTDLYLDILVNSDNAQRVKTAEYIKGCLEKYGIRATVTALSFERYSARIEGGDYDLFLGGTRLAKNQDISDFVLFAGNRFGAYDEELSRLAAACAKKTECSDEFHSISSALADTMPIIGLYFRRDTLLVNSRVKGHLAPVEDAIFTSISDWYIG